LRSSSRRRGPIGGGKTTSESSSDGLSLATYHYLMQFKTGQNGLCEPVWGLREFTSDPNVTEVTNRLVNRSEVALTVMTTRTRLRLAVRSDSKVFWSSMFVAFVAVEIEQRGEIH
jgi:hypothetical protein